jgi:PAS domain-containing protein
VTPGDQSRPHVDDALLEESAEELYEQAPCGYLSTLPDGTIVRVNHTFLEWTGATRDVLLAGTKFQALLTVGSRIYYETHYAPLLRMQGFVNEIEFEIIRG